MLGKIQRAALYVFFFSMNFEVWDPLQTDGFFSVSKLAGMIYFLSFIPSIVNIRTFDVHKPILRTIWIFFGLLVLVNATHAESIGEYFFDFTYFQNIILFWILINHEQISHRALEKGMIAFAMGSVTVSLLFYFGIGVEYDLGRVSIFGDNQNIIGQRMTVSIAILILAVLQNRLEMGKSRLFLLAPIPLMLGLLVQSGSRLAVLSFAMIFIASLFLFKTRKVSWKIMIFLVGMAAFVLIWNFSMQNDVLRERLIASLMEGNLSNRDVIWKNLLPLIKENFLFGVGQSGYAQFCQEIYGAYTSPHNVIFEILVFTGFTGLLIYFYFLYLVFRKCLAAYRQTGLLLPLLLFMITCSMIVVSHILEVKLGWAMLAYGATSALTGTVPENTDEDPVTGPEELETDTETDPA